MSNGDTVFTSSNGQFRLSVTDTGITLSGPAGGVTISPATVVVEGLGGTITVDNTGIFVRGGLVNLGGDKPVARLGDPVNLATGEILAGNPSVFA